MDEGSASNLNSHDLVGGPFAVIESDPGVFTALVRLLGIANLSLVELYDIEPWAVDHLRPHGLIFCFRWRTDTHRPSDFADPAAERVWFSNQLSEDACASHAVLNVVLNCPAVDIGDALRAFRAETEGMSPVMKGLAVSSSPMLRKAHNSLARPADIRGAFNVLTETTLEASAEKARAQRTADEPPARKRRKGDSPTKKAPLADMDADPETVEEAYHFIGYVPAYGKVWELDGLKSGPLEVGELPAAPAGADPAAGPPAGWMDVVRPALRMKMARYGGAAEGGSNIRFSLLALVDGTYERASDTLELLKRRRVALERRLDAAGAAWRESVDPTMLAAAENAFATAVQDGGPGPTYAPDFGAQRMEADLEVMELPERGLVAAWEACINEAISAKVAVEEEITRSVQANTDHMKRTHDYEPFIREFITTLQTEGLLEALLNGDAKTSTKEPKKGKGNGKKKK